jgi:uncharacterized membrane protein
MAKDVGEAVGRAVGRIARETAQTVQSGSKKAAKSPISGPKGLAAGAGLVALAPLAVKGAGKLVSGRLTNGTGPVQKAKDAVGGHVKDAVNKKVEDAGGVGGVAKEGAKSMLPGFGGGGDDGDGDDKKKEASSAAIGKNRRMPIQQAVDVAVPIKTAYNQWTQFEEWPNFMHRVNRVSQEDETHVTFKAKIWGKSKEFKAEIVEQSPDERIKWKVTEGISHTGVVTFHELAPRLTRVDVDLYVEPGSMVEKAARGMRHIKRAVRADLARYKAYIELEDEETGEWRGEIDDGKVKSKTRQRATSAARSATSRSRSSSGGSSSSRKSSGSSGSSRKSSGSSGSSRSRSSSNGSKSSGSSNGRSTSRSSGRKSAGSRS